MKSSKLSIADRQDRREGIIMNREMTRNAHLRVGRSTIQSKTTRKVFNLSALGKVYITHDQRPYPHSSTRQNAKYGRRFMVVDVNV